jgi:hypothetical protein
MLADYYYKAGVGLARFGQIGRGRQFLTAGLAVAETHRLNAWYFRCEKVLASLTGCETGCELPEPEPATHPGLGELPAVRAVAVGLREYAAAAT